MKRLLVFLCFPLLGAGCDVLNEAAKHLPEATGPTQGEVIQGLKTALSVSTDTSVKKLSAVNGYLQDAMLKILLPPEAKKITDNLSKFPMGKELVDKAVTAINRAAEDAAVEAAPIFKNAISNITFDDAMGILRGTDTAATHYLRNKTFDQLRQAFLPKIENSLRKPLVFNQSAEATYNNLVQQYNKYSVNGTLYPKVEETSLSAYVTERALQGLFIKVGEEEKLIRNNLNHQVTDILRKVFKK